MRAVVALVLASAVVVWNLEQPEAEAKTEAKAKTETTGHVAKKNKKDACDGVLRPELHFGSSPKKPSAVTKKLVSWLELMSRLDLEGDEWSDSGEVHDDAPRYLDEACAEEVRSMIEEVSSYKNISFSASSACFSSHNLTWLSTSLDSAGLFSGRSVASFRNGTLLVARLNRGTLHGLVQRFWCRYGDCSDEFMADDFGDPKYFQRINWYSNGLAVGPEWLFKAGGGALFGRVDAADETDAANGDNVVYVYPDNTTMLVGSFKDGHIVSARETRLSSLQFERGIAVLVTVEPRGPVFNYDKANVTHITRSVESLHLADPLESQYVRVSASKVQGAGVGLFTRRSVSAGDVVAFYNGVRIDSYINGRLSYYKIDNDWDEPYQSIDIPKEFHSSSSYSASLAHLANHSPKPNGVYAMIDHPRFGRIRSIVALRDLKEGEEIFCDYGYLEQYNNVNNLIDSMYALGARWTNKKPDEFNVFLKENVREARHKLQKYKPVFDAIQAAVGMFKSS